MSNMQYFNYMHGYRCALFATSEKGDHEKVKNFVLKMQQALKIIPNELLLIQAVATDPQHINFLFETDHK